MGASPFPEPKRYDAACEFENKLLLYVPGTWTTCVRARKLHHVRKDTPVEDNMSDVNPFWGQDHAPYFELVPLSRTFQLPY